MINIKLIDDIKRWWNSLFSNKIEKMLNVEIDTSRIIDFQKYSQLYYNQPSWVNSGRGCNKKVISINMANTIARDLNSWIFAESVIQIDNKDLEDEFNNFINKFKDEIPKGLVVGGLILKPFEYRGKIYIDIVPPTNFIPLEYDLLNNIVGGIFISERLYKKRIVKRLEVHRFEDNVYKIQNIFLNESDSIITDIPIEWQKLQAETLIYNLEKPLFTVWNYGNSIFKHSLDLLELYDKQRSRLEYEFHATEIKIFMDKTLFERDDNGQPIIDDDKKQVYEFVNNNGTLGETQGIKEYAPNIRYNEQLAYLNRLTMDLEDNIGISHGTYSNVDLQSKTATEIKISKQRTLQTIENIKKTITTAILDVLSNIELIKGISNAQVTFDWGDSILTDREVQNTEMLEQVDRNIISKIEYRMWYYGETQEQAQKQLYIADENDNIPSGD